MAAVPSWGGSFFCAPRIYDLEFRVSLAPSLANREPRHAWLHFHDAETLRMLFFKTPWTANWLIDWINGVSGGPHDAIPLRPIFLHVHENEGRLGEFGNA